MPNTAPADYITSADITARLSTDAYLRLFDRNGTGAADATFLQECIDDACSQWCMWTGAALPGDWTAGGASVEPAVKRHLAWMACYAAAQGFPGAGGGNPYRQHWLDAKAFAADLSRDKDARLVTSAPGRSVPRATISNTTDQSGTPTNPYGQSADKVSPSGF